MQRRDRRGIRLPVLLAGRVVGVALDAGSGGLGLLIPVPRAVGEVLQIELMPPGRRSGLRILTQVVWCRDDQSTKGAERSARLRFRCGLRICAISVRESLWLRKYLADRGHWSASSETGQRLS